MVGTEKTAYILFGFDKYGSKYNGQPHSPRTVFSEITNKHFHRTITVKLTDFIRQRLYTHGKSVNNNPPEACNGLVFVSYYCCLLCIRVRYTTIMRESDQVRYTAALLEYNELNNIK